MSNLTKASTAPFEGMGPVQIVAQMRKLQREKGGAKRFENAEGQPAKTASLDETLKRINIRARMTDAAASFANGDARFEGARLRAAQKRAAELWAQSNAPQRQGDRKEFDRSSKGEQWKAAMSRARSRIEQNGHIALVGGYGSGKTQIATELIREVTTRQLSALFVTTTQLLRAIKACYRDEIKTTEEQVISRYVRPHLLVIDEFHRRKGSDWENEQLFDIVDQRYNSLKPLVIICNQSRADFEATMDGAILDRMNETGGIIECNWPSFRGEEAK